jgi:hypothetical protein
MYIFSEIMAFIEEFTNQLVKASASPGFTWGRSGSSPASTWLQNDTVPSNRTGRSVFLSNAIITKVFVANENALAIKVQIYSHDGNEIGLTLLGSVTTGAVRTSTFDVSYSVALNKQIALRIASDSPNSAQNVVAGILMSGTLA